MRSTTLLTYLSLLIAGAAFPLSLAPFSIWPVAIISMAIFFACITYQTPKIVLKRALVYGLGMFGAGISWVFVSMYYFGGVSLLFALIGTALFCALIAIIFALPFVLCTFIPQHRLSWLLGFPAIWVLSEWCRTWVLTGFPWLFAGYSHTDTWLNGWAPIGGVLLLSYFSAFIAAALAQWRNPPIKLNACINGIFVFFIFLGGLALQQAQWSQPKEQEKSVALIQPNVDQSDRWSLSNRTQILKQLLNQTKNHWGTDIIIWPEGAIPVLYTQIKGFLDNVDAQALAHQSTLITGLPTNSNPEGPYFNSMLALGEGVGKYNKTRLVPFGEYVPIASLIRGLNSFFDLPMSSFSLGSANQSPLLAGTLSISTAICYEIAYPDLVVKNTRNTGIILTVSNDAWFGKSIAPEQHMQMARMRAIENAKPLMRGTNNGITALVDHKGKIYRQLGKFNAGVLTGKIQPRSGNTPFALVSSWPIVIFSFFLIFILIIKNARNNFKGERE